MVEWLFSCLIINSDKLGSVAGPAIQAITGRLIFEDDLRSGGPQCFTTRWNSVRTELANSMVTPGDPWMARCREMSTLPAGYIPQRKVPYRWFFQHLGKNCIPTNMHTTVCYPKFWDWFWWGWKKSYWIFELENGEFKKFFFSNY